MNATLRISRTVLAASLLAALAGAQAGEHEPTPRQQDQGYAKTQMPMKIVQVTAYTGAEVHGSGEESIGSVQDLIVRPSDGEVKLAIVDFDGIEDIEDRTIALPVRQLTPIMGEKHELKGLRYTGTVEQIRTATEFDEERWSKLSGAEMERWCHEVAERFGGTERSGGHEMEGQGTMGATRLVKASQLMDVDVKDSTGKSLGDIEEMAFDTTHGKLLFFVVDLGGFLGIGEKHYALPWRFASFRMEKGEAGEEGELAISVPISKDVLEKAPTYEVKRWEETTRAEWLERLYTHYRVEPYWGKPMEAGYQREDDKDDKDPHRRDDGGR